MSQNNAPAAVGPIRAAFTIATENSLPAVRVLASSYLRHHPGHRFVVVMLDGFAGNDLDEPFEIVSLGDIPLPNAGAFVYQYPVGELEAALRPYCLKHLLATFPFEALLYIDHDVMVFRSLHEAWTALETNDVVLIPNKREPFSDGASPTELAILQGGIYSAAFFCLRRGATADKLLDWWSERQYSEGVFDTVRGSLDHRWMDLVPAYFERVKILRNPAYDVGHGNLHERAVVQTDDGFVVDGQPLASFNFDAYSPLRPDLLSRHSLATLPAVRAVCRVYVDALLAAGYEATPGMEAAFGHLGNGVSVIPAMHRVVRQCVRHRIDFPSPGQDAEGFCRFLTIPNPKIYGADVAPIVTALLHLRPDVAAAHPGAWSDKHDAGLHQWLRDGGAAEEQLEALLGGYGHNLQRESAFVSAVQILDRRIDLQQAYPAIFSSSDEYREFGAWLTSFGRSEEGIDDGAVGGYLQAESGFSKTLNAWFSHLDLLAEHPILYQDRAIDSLVDRMTHALVQFPQLELADLQAFARVARARRDDLLLASLRYNPKVREQIGGFPSLFNLDRIRRCLGQHGAESAMSTVTTTLLAGTWITPIAQHQAFWAGNQSVRQLFPDADQSQDEALQCVYYTLDRHGFKTSHAGWNDWADRLIEQSRQPMRPGVNLFGYIDTATGIGESARSMARTLEATGIACSQTTLGSGFQAVDDRIDTDLKALYGAHESGFDLNVIVANADDFLRVRDWLPQDIWPGRRSVGYWVWETEALPSRFDTAARGLQAIWTPSEYSASAIRNAVEIPVHVVPHLPDFAAIDAARPDRAGFGIPGDTLAYGYFFDSKSDLERKNPAALIEAFRLAFGTRKDVVLVLKVNSPAPGRYDYERLKLRTVGINVVWIEDTLSREQSCNLMASLDVYVSLHRSEGFGLTLAEAMIMGKPVIATGYSGNMDFMAPDCALLVDHAVISTHRAYGPYPAGSRWSEPSIEHAAQLMQVLEASERRQQLGEQARSHVRRVLGPAVVGQRLREALAALRTGPPHKSGERAS